MGLTSAAPWHGSSVSPSCCLPPALSTLMTQPNDFPVSLQLGSMFFFCCILYIHVGFSHLEPFIYQ